MLTGNSITGAGDWEKTQVELLSESQQKKVTSQKYREDDQGLLVVKKELIMKFRKGTVIQHHISLNFQGNQGLKFQTVNKINIPDLKNKDIKITGNF